MTAMRISAKNLGLTAIAVALAAVGFVLATSSGHKGPAPAPMPAMPVPVVTVQTQTVPVYLEFVATTQAIRSVTLQAKVTGYLDTRPVGDGADVRPGDLLYRIDPRDYQAALNQATAQAQRDAAAFDYAQVTEKRNATLNRQGWVSADVYDHAASSLGQSQGTLAADAAAVETARLNLGYTEIHAPFAGRLGASLVHEGTLISAAGTQLNSLVQLDPIWVAFNPSETDLAQLARFRTGTDIAAQVTIPDDGEKHYDGKLTFLNNTVDQTTGTILARATIDNPDHTLLPGEFVHVRLHVADQKDALLVPQVALGSSQFGRYVYVVDHGKAAQRMVTTGATYGEMIVITKGVAAGDQVIVGNTQKIGPGAPVQPLVGNKPTNQ